MRAPRPVRAFVAALAFFAAGAALAGEKGGLLFYRVTDDQGAVLEGHGRLKKDAVEIETSGGLKKIPFAKVASIEEVDPEGPPLGSDPAKDRAEFETRWKALAERPAKDPGDAVMAWVRLATWAKKRALAPEAKRVWEKVLEQKPDDAEAHKGVGEAKDDEGNWKPAREVFAAKKAKLGKGLPEACELGRWAIKQGLDDEALDAVGPIAWQHAYEPALLQYLRPLLDRRFQTTHLGFPLKGRWQASQDSTHHHEKKAFAVYAIDFYRDVDGKQYKGSGKDLADWHSFGQPIYACADGNVIWVRDEFPDNPINQLEGREEKHNGVMIEHESCEASFYIHCQKGSILVKNGDHVKKGQLIARVGNSGGSAAPHLHFTLLDRRYQVSIPWRLDDYALVTEGGTKVKVKRGHPHEGETVEGEPEVPADAPGGAH